MTSILAFRRNMQKCNSTFKFCMLSEARIVKGSNGQVYLSTAATYWLFAISEFGVLHKIINMHDVFDGRYIKASSQLIEMPFGMESWMSPKNRVVIRSRFPCGKNGQFLQKWDGTMKRKLQGECGTGFLWCGCSTPEAEWLVSSAVGIAQLVAHAAGEFILCREGLQCSSSQITLGFFCYIIYDNNCLQILPYFVQMFIIKSKIYHNYANNYWMQDYFKPVLTKCDKNKHILWIMHQYTSLMLNCLKTFTYYRIYSAIMGPLY